MTARFAFPVCFAGNISVDVESDSEGREDTDNMSHTVNQRMRDQVCQVCVASKCDGQSFRSNLATAIRHSCDASS